ncbi:MAG TPA: NUDIX domain-containing protein [Solirubrobacteraceae bacterium]|jgi:8-oxo-dGTP pyrophosphatase MutT (NUDIX family)
MPIAEHLRRLREFVGHELLLVPSVAVLVWDESGRLLLVRDLDTGRWQTIGGAIEPDESPQQAALRETSEEAGIGVRLTGLRGAVGGPGFRISYPNGDQVAYVSCVFDAQLSEGEIRPDGEETSAVRWFSNDELAELDMSAFTRVLLSEVNVLSTTRNG